MTNKKAPRDTCNIPKGQRVYCYTQTHLNCSIKHSYLSITKGVIFLSKKRNKGTGSIHYDDKRKMFIGQFELGYDENGKRKRKTVYGRTKADVQTKLKSIEMQIYTGIFVNESEITIYQLAKQINDDKLNQNEIKEATYYRHLETLKILKPIYNIPLQDCNETQIKDFLFSKLYYSQSNLRKIYSLLNQTFKEAKKRRIINNNPMEFVKAPKSKKQTIPVRALTKEEQRRLLEVLACEDINYREQMLLSLSLGLRMGEVNALHVEDVNFYFNQISIHRTISKGQKGEAILNNHTKTEAGTRTLSLTASAKDLLKDCIGQKTKGLIFAKNNKLITTSQVNSQFVRLLKKYDIIDESITNGKVDLHSLRHTFGTRCAEAGMPPKVLQEIMGHTDIKVTMNTYFYATNEYLAEHINKVNSILENEGLTISAGTSKKIKAV